MKNFTLILIIILFVYIMNLDNKDVTKLVIGLHQRNDED
ncbi:hypothetical protein B4064_0263 [Caldibacillus thermoamylovorans]|uniref:Uncharacterized protein n=1 Tax=Caldibacillus thermoamylovorans TaxID=35841 RepID=A0A0D0FFP5_9BACI|nr:hypothetical protein B4166_0856 [Caldibacillus thermoamylovorans]KIO62789.1 hypothetical protein B4064_0263 [Caldibacillus thermoamylovorans]KIO65820.1 hypothetical protein B4065_2433 [Caldibacillus thermoamylovorans]KIO70199.1 hypothetical protein B4167_0891 [Caldibacillus thermoamylovorans]